MMRINERYSYCNKSERDGDPMDGVYIYEHGLDILYPQLKHLGSLGKQMVFDDFIHGIKLYLEHGKDGMLDLNHIYTVVPQYVEL